MAEKRCEEHIIFTSWILTFLYGLIYKYNLGAKLNYYI